MYRHIVAERQSGRKTHGGLVATVTCVILEPDGVEIERRRQVQDVRTAAFQQVRDHHLRPGTHSVQLTCTVLCECVRVRVRVRVRT